MNKIYVRSDPDNMWRDIPGYEGKYQASRIGGVRRLYRNERARDLTPYKKKCGVYNKPKWYHVKLNNKETPLHRVVAAAFLPPVPEGMIVYHINGILSDNRAVNLGFTTQRELGHLTGHYSRRMTVFKIDRNGEAVEIYRSARAAAKANNMSYQTVLDRCHNRIKNPYELDGYTYQFEEQ